MLVLFFIICFQQLELISFDADLQQNCISKENMLCKLRQKGASGSFNNLWLANGLAKI
jgi:hypothetical protein